MQDASLTHRLVLENGMTLQLSNDLLVTTSVEIMDTITIEKTGSLGGVFSNGYIKIGGDRATTLTVHDTTVMTVKEEDGSLPDC